MDELEQVLTSSSNSSRVLALRPVSFPRDALEENWKTRTEKPASIYRLLKETDLFTAYARADMDSTNDIIITSYLYGIQAKRDEKPILV